MQIRECRRLTQMLTCSTIRILSSSAINAKSFRQRYQDFWRPKPVNCPPYEHFTQIGDPVLRTPAGTVPEELITSKEVDLIIEKMIKVLRKFDCVGIAAPQIGISLRIIAMEFRKGLQSNLSKTVYEARKMETLPLTVFINPELKVSSYEKHKHPESCMSIRGYTAEVERYHAVSLFGKDRLGDDIELKLSGWNARIAQHEMDHLDGKLYIDQMDSTTFACTCWEMVNTKGGRIEIPFYK